MKPLATLLALTAVTAAFAGDHDRADRISRSLDRADRNRSRPSRVFSSKLDKRTLEAIVEMLRNIHP